MKRALVGFSIAVLIGCGGSQNTNDDNVGQTHPAGSDDPAGDLDVEPNAAGTEGEADTPDPEPPEPQGPAFKLVLKNTHDQELAFNMDNGWGANVQMYSGEPPKAETVLPFETFCTAACDAADRCPTCKQPQRVKDIKKAQKIDLVKPGETLELEWDGEIHVYQDVKKGKKGCQCYQKEPVPPATYTLRVCGLRLTKSAKRSSTIECVANEVTTPASDPQVIEYEFAGPPKTAKKAKNKNKKKKKKSN